MTEQATPGNRIGLGSQATSSDPLTPPASPETGSDPITPSPSPPGAAGDLFGAHLQPVLRSQCEGRLSEINWFRTDWQRGGALTGYATWRGDEDEAHPAVVKMPIPPGERLWLTRLQDASPDGAVVPRVYAQGMAIGGYDLAWVVMERLPHGPVDRAWGGAAYELAVDAAARFYHAADAYALDGRFAEPDWEQVLAKARKHIRAQDFPEAGRWSAALKKAHKKLRKWLKVWGDRAITGHIHGDLHLGNAMTRHAPPMGPAVLFDLANVRPGHWVEDAIYFEHLYWAHPDRLNGFRIASELAKARRAYGLPADADWPHLAQIRRALFALGTPVMMRQDGARAHILAALEVLEREVG